MWVEKQGEKQREGKGNPRRYLMQVPPKKPVKMLSRKKNLYILQLLD